MCGRFTQTVAQDQLEELFELAEGVEMAPQYNIAPTDPVLIVRAADGLRRATSVRWGLVPPWRKDYRKKAPLINARSETAHRLRTFRDAFRRRRCLVLADGWYEWRHLPDGKQPYRFVRFDRRPFGLAGLWERFYTEDGELMESATILTVAPNTVAEQVHDRMPLILAPADYDAWLDPHSCDPNALQPLLITPSARELEFYAVGRRVNSVRNREATLIDPVAEPDPPPTQGSLF